MEIRNYDPKYKQKFIDLNTAWIKDNFGFLEKEDIETFQNIDQEIADGAMIFIAVQDEQVLAVCMTKQMDQHVWEICKLAADKRYKGHGAGSSVFQKCMDYAIANGAKRLFILSNSKLKPALHIYQKYGFQEIALEDYAYIRGDIAFEYMVSPEA